MEVITMFATYYPQNQPDTWTTTLTETRKAFDEATSMIIVCIIQAVAPGQLTDIPLSKFTIVYGSITLCPYEHICKVKLIITDKQHCGVKIFLS